MPEKFPKRLRKLNKVKNRRFCCKPANSFIEHVKVFILNVANLS
jgi:hypothetical protein